jgi:hypothetical protein
VDDEHAALPGRAGRVEKLIDLGPRLFTRQAVQIEVRLDRVVARTQLAQQALIDPRRQPLDIFVGGGDVEPAGAFDQIRQLGVRLRLIALAPHRRRRRSHAAYAPARIGLQLRDAAHFLGEHFVVRRRGRLRRRRGRHHGPRCRRRADR